MPQVNVPNLQDLIPQIVPAPEQTPTTRTRLRSAPAPDSGTTTTTPGADQTTQESPTPHAISMNEAQMFLQFLLGGGA